MEKKNEGDGFDLDKQLRELLREKEIVSVADKNQPILYWHIFFHFSFKRNIVKHHQVAVMHWYVEEEKN